MASLVSLAHELRAVKGELDEKVYQCKREQIEKKFSEFNPDELVMEDAIKDAALTFEVVRNETKSIRSLKDQLNDAKTAMGNEVTKSHSQLKTALSKMKATDSCSPSVHKFNAVMLEKKIEGAEMNLEMGLKKLRKIEVYEKELDTATADLLSVLSTYQQRCVDRILKSPTPSNVESSLPTKQSAQVHVVVESIRRLRDENEKLKIDLESMASSTNSGNHDSLMIQELENEISQLKLQLFELQNNNEEMMEREKNVAKGNPEDPEDNPAETESEEETESENEKEMEMEMEIEMEMLRELADLETEMETEVDIESDDKVMTDINRVADEDSVQSEEDSYGFEDMLPSPVPMPKPVVEMEDKLAELELHDMGDIKLVQPDYEQLVMDQMRHEEELEEYAVKILTLKETISELEDENRELKGQIVFSEDASASGEEIQQLESEVSMWRLKYEESASGSSQVHRLRVELERTKAKSKKRITLLQEDLQTLQKQGSDRIKNLINKFKAFQEEGAARVQSLEVELEKSRAEVEQLKNRHDDEAEEEEAETDSSEPIFHDESSEDDEVDEPENVEVTSQSPECAGEDATDGVDQSEQAQTECFGENTVGQAEEAGKLQEQLAAMKKSMAEAEARASIEIKALHYTIASMKAEKEMKQEVISSLHEQLNTAEMALTDKTKSMHFPTICSYGDPFDSDSD